MCPDIPTFPLPVCCRMMCCGQGPELQDLFGLRRIRASPNDEEFPAAHSHLDVVQPGSIRMSVAMAVANPHSKNRES